MYPMIIQQIWILLCGTLVFFMQAGFTCYEAGFVQSKNVISVSIENLLTFMITAGLFAFAGFPLMFGENIFTMPQSHYSYLFLHIMFAAVAVTIFAGAMSERSRLSALLTSSAVAAALIYPVYGRFVWGDMFGSAGAWLKELGYMDYAGASVVHTTAGFITLAGLIVVGSRRETKSGKSNIPLATLGVFILWFGWLGFNGGNQQVTLDKMGLVFLNTTLAATFGMGGALVTNFLVRRKGRYLISIFNGVLGGLVAITAASGWCTPWAALSIGFIAGAFADLSTLVLDKYHIDDVVNAIPAHLIGGICGILLLPFFVQGRYLQCASRIEQLGAQTLGMAVNFTWAFGLSLLMFFIIKKTMGIRVSPDEERKGLNIVEFNDIYSWESYMEISSYESQINDKNRLLMKQASLLSKTEAREKENLARSLHDGLGQSLAALKLLLQMNKSETSKQALDLTEASIAEMRNVLNDLRPAWLEDGLDNALAYMTESLNGLSDLSCTFSMEGELPAFDETVSLNIYRLIQEALTNVVKHSQATEARVTCRTKGDLALFTVEDNGVGFDPSDTGCGIGISSMTDRARMMGGNMKLTAGPGHGTKIEIEVPVNYGTDKDISR